MIATSSERRTGIRRHQIPRRTEFACSSIPPFLHDFRVPFDNSKSERDLRLMKLKQKISGGFSTAKGARHFATIHGYLATARKQGRSPLDVLRDPFRGHPFQPAIALPE